MNEIYNIPTDSDIMDVARMWYLRLEEDAGNDQVLAQFDTWADADPVHREAFNAVVDFWSQIDNMPEIIEMRETGTSFPERNDPPTTQENIVAISSVRKMAGMGEKWHKWSIAAMVLITFGFAISLYVNYLPPGTYRTATGEQRTVQLADGSTVYLNTHSKIKVDFSGDIRKIHLLQGEARFDVAKDKNRPFIVETSRGNIRAVGTSFNVYDSAEMVEVLVFEGT
ncbi:MAG: FecR domain-containing protein, partial [Emcibacter sp.]|nr:FecR domain-containing protein [Emcibacter sp.]